MEFSRYRKYLCLLILGLSAVFICFLLTNHYVSVIPLLNVSFIQSYVSLHIFPGNISITNETEFNYTFESRLFDFYPHLPIHIFTQNLSLIGNRSKLILFGNRFFGDPHWRFLVPGRSSQQISTNI
jgi:hypothetical protein